MRARASSPQHSIDADNALTRLPGDTGHLRLFLLYRVLLGIALLLVYFGVGRGPLGTSLPGVFTLTVHLYLGLTIISLIMHLQQVGSDETQAQLAVFVDIVLITIMMHASGGVQSGLGMLIAVSIALGSLSQVGQTALAFAALASLGVLTERIYSQISGTFSDTVQSPGHPNSTAVALGDVDGDGDVDVVVGDGTSQSNTAWLNDGTGAFASSEIPDNLPSSARTGRRHPRGSMGL